MFPLARYLRSAVKIIAGDVQEKPSAAMTLNSSHGRRAVETSSEACVGEGRLIEKGKLRKGNAALAPQTFGGEPVLHTTATATATATANLPLFLYVSRTVRAMERTRAPSSLFFSFAGHDCICVSRFP
jgi:hypothetical protein